MREAVEALQPLKPRAASTSRTTAPTRSILDLEADLARADRLDPANRESFLRNLYVDAHKGQQGNWKPREACAQGQG